jgi:hypothetical protein
MFVGRQSAQANTLLQGMSEDNGGTLLVSDANVKTQTLNIQQQLEQGIRYFDIRPVVDGGEWFTGHYGCPNGFTGCQGRKGQSVSSSFSLLLSGINEHSVNTQIQST